MKEKLRLPPALDGALWLHRNTGRVLRMHRHIEPEVNLVLRGRAGYMLADRRYEMGPGSQAWFFPDQDHILLEQSPDLVMWIGVFRPRLIRRVCATPATRPLLQRNPAGELCKQLSPEAARRLPQLFEQIAAARDDPQMFNAGLAYALLAAWEAHRRAEVMTARDIHPAVERAARILRDEPEATKLSELASRVGLSPSRLSRLFARHAGMPLVRFRQQQALERFHGIIQRQPHLTLIAAALQAGFGSYPQFHRVYKQLTGRGPANYRRESMVD